MDRLEQVARRIREVIAGSTVPEDPEHSRNTLGWLLQLDPTADAALRIAALGHDIDRAVEERKVRRADFADYDAFKAAHARNSADILGEILHECGVEDEALRQEVDRLVCRHEVGGDPRSDLLKDADSHLLLRREPAHTTTSARAGWRRGGAAPGATCGSRSEPGRLPPGWPTRATS